MDTKPKIPQRLYLLWTLGGISWAFALSTVLISDTDLILLDEVQFPLTIFLGGVYIIGAVIGAILGIIVGRIGYAIKPIQETSMARAALVIVGVPVLVALLLIGYFKLRGASYEAFLQQAGQKQAAIPALSGSFQKLFSKGDCPPYAVSNDGKYLAAGGCCEGGKFWTRVWDIEKNARTGKSLVSDQVSGLAFSPDGRTLAVAAFPGVSWWDFKTGEQPLPTIDYSGIFSDLAYSPDGQLLASTDVHGAIILWDAKSGQQVANLGAEGDLSSVAFSPDGRLLAAGGSANQVILWDTQTFKQVDSLPQPKSSWGAGRFQLHDLAFSPDGKRLVAAGSNDEFGNVVLWDVEKRALIGVTQPVTHLKPHVDFSPDGRQLVSSGFGSSTLYFWYSTNLEALGSLNKPIERSAEAEFLPDGRLVACYENGEAHIGIWKIDKTNPED